MTATEHKPGRRLFRNILLAGLSILIVSMVCMAYSPHISKISLGSLFGVRCYKKIHMWSNNPRERGFPPRGVKYFKCPGSACDVKLYTDTSYASSRKSDALILYHRNGWDWKKMFAHRPSGQKWIFYSLESPLHTSTRVIPQVARYNDTYDYIMSYRTDSDFRAGYGEYFPNRPMIDENDTTNWAKERPKLVAWVASNCKGPSWPRSKFVANLSKYIHVDSYGKCGTEDCKKNSQDCERNLKQYKFYLALENSECRDYISEKFWNYLNRGLVPIVFGPPRADYEKVAPPDSFIHVQDFKTVKDLADYIQRVADNDTLYNSYFEWRKRGSFRSDLTYRAGRILCDVADRLVTDEIAEQNGKVRDHIRKDWKEWWSGSCFKGRIPQ